MQFLNAIISFSKFNFLKVVYANKYVNSFIYKIVLWFSIKDITKICFRSVVNY